MELKDAKPYDAPGHFGCISFRLHDKELSGTKSFWVGLTHFLPSGGAEMAGGDPEKLYFVVSGTITVITEDGKESNLGPNDSLYIPSGEKRRIINKTNMPVTMLVVVTYPKQ